MKYTSLFDINLLNRRYTIHQGGTSSTKTYTNLQYLACYAAKYDNKVISIVSESMPHLRRGALRDFVSIINGAGFDVQVDHNKTSATFVFSNTGTIIEFFGVEESSKVRGGRRDILFINECNNVPYETFYELDVRTKIRTILDFNPVARFWVHDKLIPLCDQERIDKNLDEDIYILKISSYLDAIDSEGNSVLPQATIDSILRRKSDEQWFRVYGRGEIGSYEGMIFPNYKKAASFPDYCKWICYGLDFGYTNDPTTLIKIGYHMGELFFQEKLFRVGLTNSDINNKLGELGVKRTDEIVADSAEPKSIEEIRRLGWNIRGATKGPDSIINGIDLIKQYPINVTIDSVNMIKEADNYQWKKDKQTEKYINVPQDAWNHCWDAARYGCTYKLKKYDGPGIVWGS